MKTLLTALVLSSVVFSAPTFADGSLQNLSKAGSQSLNASGNLILGTTQAVVGVVAIPLKVVAKIGEVSDKSSEEMLRFSTEGVKKPLKIDDETISIGPSPAIAMARRDN